MFRPSGRIGARLFKDRSAVAYIEFAYSLPLLMFLCMYAAELANIALTNARVSQIASMTADNAARVRDRIDETDIIELFVGSVLAGRGIDVTQNGRIILSTVEDNEATPANLNDQVITWQRCKGVKSPAVPYGDEDTILPGPIGTGARTIAARPGNPVILADVYYEYQPLISEKLFGPITMRYQTAFSVRDRVDQTMQNGKNLPAGQRPTCDFFSA